MVLYGIFRPGWCRGVYFLQPFCLKNCCDFFFQFFLTSSFPSFPQLMVLCGILDQTVPVCWTVPGMHIWQPNVLNYWAESFFPICSLQAVMCFYKYYSWTLFYSGPYAFSLCFGENFACLWPFCPIFHSVFCYEFPLWVQFWVVHLSKCTGVYFTTNCFGTLLWTFFPSFPSQAVECFLQVLVLSTFLQWALSFFPLCWEKFACLWPFLTLFHSVFCYRFPSWAQFGFVTNPKHSILQILWAYFVISCWFSFSFGVTWFCGLCKVMELCVVS